MKIGPKMKKVLTFIGGTSLLALCVVSMKQCHDASQERDTVRATLEAEHVRADSLQKELNSLEENRSDWVVLAKSAADSVRTIRKKNHNLHDSIVVLNKSIQKLGADNKSLQSQLKNARASRVKMTNRANTNVQVRGSGNVVHVNNNTVNNYYSVPDTAAAAKAYLLRGQRTKSK